MNLLLATNASRTPDQVLLYSTGRDRPCTVSLAELGAVEEQMGKCAIVANGGLCGFETLRRKSAA